MVEFKLYVEEKRLCRQDLNTCIVTGDANKIMQGGGGNFRTIRFCNLPKVRYAPHKEDSKFWRDSEICSVVVLIQRDGIWGDMETQKWEPGDFCGISWSRIQRK